jgi:hypothetical protein
MADDEQSTSGMVPGLVQDVIAQLRAVTEGLQDLATPGERRLQAHGPFPLPGALSAAQVTSIAGSIAAQRRSIEALKAQLSSFDEQLAVLEQILAPLAEWSRTWAELEGRLLNAPGGPGGESWASTSLPIAHYGRPACSWRAVSPGSGQAVMAWACREFGSPLPIPGAPPPVRAEVPVIAFVMPRAGTARGPGPGSGSST